ncbi:ROK family protein [Paenibacillus sp. Y412MC10]|uniref:ROK family protein n=1 Tax=Geobacillus sp. (strain Y412MC10) TaxID=481743 RepID=UPI0011AB6F4D|nr:ROK family protein [Paenibacillus sp. Y412MC10]
MSEMKWPTRCETEPEVALGIDVGGTKILVGYVTKSGQMLSSQSYRMDRTTQASSLDSVWRAIENFLSEPWAGREPDGIGIGVVGQTDPDSGVWMQAINIPIYKPVNLKLDLAARYELPVAVDNDVHAAVHAELRFGAGRAYSSFVYLNVGTGIAMGIVEDGRIIRGTSNYAGEIGHMSVDPQGEPCICGRLGCLEPIASGGGMLERARQKLKQYANSSLHRYGSRLHTQLIFDEARRGDPLAERIKREAQEALGFALTNVVNLLNPEAVILGGGVFQDGNFASDLLEHIRKFSLPAASAGLKCFQPSELDPKWVGLLGAASLVWR